MGRKWNSSPGRTQGRIGYRKHGYGCTVDLPTGRIDFDFGKNGETSGFDPWRLAGFAGERLPDYGFASERMLETCFEAELAAGSLVHAGYIFYRAADAAANFIEAKPGRPAGTYGFGIDDQRTMSRTSEATQIELIALDVANLRRLAASAPAEFQVATPVAAGALPPAHVAARALAQLDEGTPALWCVPFLIVAAATGAVLGGCRFKGAPVDGSVEIGYGVAKSERGRGIAGAALAKLIEMAAATGEVSQIVAHILPGNIASSKVVARLGFSKGHSFVDSDGEVVVHWAYSVTS